MSARTVTTVIRDVISSVGKPKYLNADWEIPVERPGWECKVSLNVGYSCNPYVDRRRVFYIAVHAHGWRTDDPNRGSAFYTAILGSTSPSRVTRKWIESVLRREIETARMAALAFTDADLVKSDAAVKLDENYYRGMREYFDASLKDAKP